MHDELGRVPPLRHTSPHVEHLGPVKPFMHWQEQLASVRALLGQLAVLHLVRGAG